MSSVSAGPPPLALTYHGVGHVPMSADPSGLWVRPQDVERHIGVLRRWGYRLVTFAELAYHVSRDQGRGHAALTFDDGLADNLEVLAPLLERLEATATVFVVSGWLGLRHPAASRGRVMTAEELRRLAATGVEIGAHTVTHPDLRALGREGALAELRGSREALEEVLAAPVRTAAYPYGYANRETVVACADAGFEAAARTCGWGSWSEPHALPRQVMHNGCGVTGLRLKRDDRYEGVVRTLPGRALRRCSRRAHGLAHWAARTAARSRLSGDPARRA